MKEYNFSTTVVCNFCNKEYTISCNESDYNNWKNGEGYIQDILSYLSDDERELLISKTCGKCFDDLFVNEDEVEEEEKKEVISSFECAKYIFDSDCEQISYQEYIQEGNDPRDHILYHAAVVLNQTQDFENDINNYLAQN